MSRLWSRQTAQGQAYLNLLAKAGARSEYWSCWAGLSPTSLHESEMGTDQAGLGYSTCQRELGLTVQVRLQHPMAGVKTGDGLFQAGSEQSLHE